MKLSNFSSKIILLISLMMAGISVISVAVWFELRTLAVEAKDISATRVPQVERMANLRFEVARIQSQTRQVMLDKTVEARKKTIGDIGKYIASMQSEISDFSKYIFSDKARKQIDDMRLHLGKYSEEQKKYAALALEFKDEEAIQMIEVLNKTRVPLVKVLAEAGDWQKEILTQRTEKVEQEVALLQKQMMGGVVVLLLISGFMGVLLIRKLNRRINEVVTIANRVASKDLSQRVHPTGSDEFSLLIMEMGVMRDALFDVVTTTRGASDGILNAASEVALGNKDLSSRTEDTASNLEETASSMEQITQSVKHSSDAAVQASELANGAASIAAKGGEVVSKVVETMHEIQQSSKKISDIIGVIDGIAFQTNILALNAAVEAARAGEQGRGFAVVAGEVRSLAQRSSSAAKEIKDLITASVDKVQVGNDLVQDAGKTMSEIVQSVSQVNGIIAEISASARQQTSGIEQVNSAMGQLEQMTQQNAALVEESSAAAHSLEEQAMHLADTVSVFKLN